MKTNCPDCNKELKMEERESDISNLFPWVEKGRMIKHVVIEKCNCK